MRIYLRKKLSGAIPMDLTLTATVARRAALAFGFSCEDAKCVYRRVAPFDGNLAAMATAILSLTVALTSFAAAAPENSPGPRLQKFIENARCYASLPRHAHKPDFRTVPVEEKKYRESFSWIMDGGQRIGLLNLSYGEIEMFRFFPPADGVQVKYEMPEVHSWVTVQGPRLSIVPQNTWTGKGEMVGLRDRGELLRLRYREKFGGNKQLVHRFTLRFDPVLGYIWDCAFQMQMDKPERFEYANLYTAGLGDSRDKQKRYQKCIWSRRDGKLCYMYQNPLSMMQWGGGDEWTDIPQDSGFVGFVAEPEMNPFLEIIRSTPGTRFETCSVWYDQHVFGLPPQQKGADGLYHITAEYRLLSLPLPIAKELEDAARTMLPAPARTRPMGFRQGIVNDFETLITAGTLFNGCMWGHSAQRETGLGHSGTHSLRLRGGHEARPMHGGPRIHVTTGKRYRFSAWVRTRGVTEGAYLRVKNGKVGRAAHRSKSLTGDNDWTLLEIEFEANGASALSSPAHDGEDAGERHSVRLYSALAVPALVVDGEGTAWFDDIQLIETQPPLK